MPMQLRNPDALQSHIRGLRYALATTTCQATVGALQQMLANAETRLRKQERVWTGLTLNCSR